MYIVFEYIRAVATFIWKDDGAIPNGNDEGRGSDRDSCRGSSSVCNVSFAFIAFVVTYTSYRSNLV